MSGISKRRRNQKSDSERVMHLNEAVRLRSQASLARWSGDMPKERVLLRLAREEFAISLS